MASKTQPEKKSARLRAYDRIRGGILTGEFPAGSFIEEEQMCALAAVSRTPVREALTRLAAEGFVDQMPRRGTMVRHVTATELLELYELRRVIEGHAARRVCTEGLQVPRKMHDMIDRMERLDETNEAERGEHVDLNREFHHALVECAGNHSMTRVFEGLHDSVTRVARTAIALDVARRVTIDQEHRALLTALENRDADAAVALLERHLTPVPELMTRLPR
ncbi:hypothetical protein BFP70_19140 [Thioclava sp. SK-1]|uniref:GntR family transcriptional regulator n=1 Tax=Thioclava sp. SK-1 TaxID=1889770 RepID=UPI00082464B1|nr:GntR family transcriptional regulator [Thioclava sp. SK-1]OCX58174.1 hypothetical protein BFP70_19140 [Thioclava sp. SK-1]